jgi:hypothetical protein
MPALPLSKAGLWPQRRRLLRVSGDATRARRRTAASLTKQPRRPPLPAAPCGTKAATRSTPPTWPELAQADYLGADLRDSLAPVDRASDGIHQRTFRRPLGTSFSGRQRVAVGNLLRTRFRDAHLGDKEGAQPAAGETLLLGRQCGGATPLLPQIECRGYARVA